MARIVQCPGSWQLCHKYPQAKEQSEAAAEGTAAHWVASEALRGNRIALNTIAPNGVPVTWEMIDGADMYVEALGSGPYHIEEWIPPSPDIHPDNSGTPDAWSYIDGIITIPDYKFGRGFVEVFENWQLVNYACLIIDQLGIDGRQEQFVRLKFMIIQPRSFHRDGPIRVWTCMASEIRAQRNRIRSSIVDAQKPDAPCHVGPSCGDCSARAYCGTLQRASLTAVDESTRVTPMELPPDAIGQELRTLRHAAMLLDARQSGLEEVALSTAKSGKPIPGFKLEQGQGRQRWTVPVGTIEALGAAMKIKLTEAQPITPKQAIAAGLSAEVVAKFSETPNGKLKLVQDDGTFLRRVFTQSGS